MRTKFFSLTFPSAVGIQDAIPTFEAVQEIERVVNQWLAQNPGINIISVKQDLSFQTAGPGFGHIVVSVWYEEKRT